MGLILEGGSFTGEVMEAKAIRPVATMAEWVVIRYPRRGMLGKSIGGAPGAFSGGQVDYQASSSLRRSWYFRGLNNVP